MMTLGRNDIGFADIMNRYVVPGLYVGCDHNPADGGTWLQSADYMRTRLTPVYEDVWHAINTTERRAQRDGAYAPVIVLAYPQVTRSAKS